MSARPLHGLILPRSAQETHVHVIGSSGVGKSQALLTWFLQKVRADEGVCLVDVHGSLFEQAKSNLALLARAHPELSEQIILLDLMDPTWTCGLDILNAVRGSVEYRASLAVDVAKHVWQFDSNDAPRMTRLMTHTFQCLAYLDMTLAQLPRLLRDREWRESLLSRVPSQDVVDYFRSEFPANQAGALEWTPPPPQQGWPASVSASPLDIFPADDDPLR